MATQHRPWSFFGGDDWFLNLQLTDSSNTPYDLNALSEIKWLLHNPSGEIHPHTEIQTKTNAAARMRFDALTGFARYPPRDGGMKPAKRFNCGAQC